MNRKQVFEYTADQYGIEPDFPWARTPNCAILRHTSNRKWFAAILDITEDKLGQNGTKLIDALLLKCDPVLKSSLIDGKTIFPGYHMNKEHWITILLNSKIEKEKVCNLLDLSYNLTKQGGNHVKRIKRKSI